MSDSRHRSPPPRGREVPLREPSPEAHSTRGFVSDTLSAARRGLGKFVEYCTGPSDFDVEQLQIEVQRLREVDSELQARSVELEKEIKRMERKLQDRENQREGLKDVTKQLAVAQRFLSTADSLSQAEAVRAMEALNEEIFQLTSIVADRVQIEEKKRLSNEEEVAILEHSPLLSGLRAFLDIVVPKQLEDTLAIQIGWQAILVPWCSDIIQAWVVEDLSHGRGVNSGMQTMYQAILSENDHAVAGRWRSIVYKVTSDVSPEIERMTTGIIIETLTYLPLLCGYILNQGGLDDIYRAFEQRIGPLLDKCLKFRKMVGEGITSTDIRPYCFSPGERYGPNVYADLEYEDEKKEKETSNAQQGMIACSLSLGLYCTRTTRNRDGKFEESRELILKPKVILQDTLKRIIE